MVIKSVDLALVAGPTGGIPKTDKPEFAFAGRSNVGKSTLINGLMNRKHYARVSANPGKTQTINYYLINDAFYLVDLPGYGYATAGLKARAAWGRMIETYLARNKNLQTIFLLVDIRHKPTADDCQMFSYIVEAGFSPVVIATKADKIKRSQLAKQSKQIRETLLSGIEGKKAPEDFPLLCYSSLSKAGREEILQAMEAFLE